MNYWNKLYINNKHMSVWPWSDLISLVNKFSKNTLKNKSSKILELGCGAGANIPFFLKQECSYYGIDNSEFIINQLKKKKKKKNQFNLW
jgi:ubiquinone/menaquinone biosynthesis C-methylase UbiE